METTGLYGITQKALFENRARIGDKPYFYEVSDAEAIDLDKEIDFEYLNFFMSRIISPVQTVQELEFIKRSHSAVEILPLDLSTLLYCYKQKVPFVNPKEFSNNELHIDIIQNTDSVLSLLKIENQTTAFEKEFVAVCRFLHQLFFIN